MELKNNEVGRGLSRLILEIWVDNVSFWKLGKISLALARYVFLNSFLLRLCCSSALVWNITCPGIKEAVLSI
jgi:hypothetical protein